MVLNSPDRCDSEPGHSEPFLIHTQIRTESPVTLQLINPEDLPVPSTYTHVVVATGTRMVFIAGQEPEDVYANLGRALAASGARPEQVTKITIYVVRHRPEHLPVIERARKHLFGDHKPADPVVGVETLAGPGYLIEVDAIAVTDR